MTQNRGSSVSNSNFSVLARNINGDIRQSDTLSSDRTLSSVTSSKFSIFARNINGVSDFSRGVFSENQAFPDLSSNIMNCGESVYTPFTKLSCRNSFQLDTPPCSLPNEIKMSPEPIEMSSTFTPSPHVSNGFTQVSRNNSKSRSHTTSAHIVCNGFLPVTHTESDTFRRTMSSSSSDYTHISNSSV
eukprot:473010_1